jgi:hypothetical protein
MALQLHTQGVLGSISDHRPTVLIEVFYGIPERFQQNARIVTYNRLQALPF